MIPATLVAVPVSVFITGVGALVGMGAVNERWTPPSRVTVSAMPGPDTRMRLGVRIAF